MVDDTTYVQAKEREFYQHNNMCNNIVLLLFFMQSSIYRKLQERSVTLRPLTFDKVDVAFSTLSDATVLF